MHCTCTVCAGLFTPLIFFGCPLLPQCTHLTNPSHVSYSTQLCICNVHLEAAEDCHGSLQNIIAYLHFLSEVFLGLFSTVNGHFLLKMHHFKSSLNAAIVMSWTLNLELFCNKCIFLTVSG